MLELMPGAFQAATWDLCFHFSFRGKDPFLWKSYLPKALSSTENPP